MTYFKCSNMLQRCVFFLSDTHLWLFPLEIKFSTSEKFPVKSMQYKIYLPSSLVYIVYFTFFHKIVYPVTAPLAVYMEITINDDDWYMVCHHFHKRKKKFLNFLLAFLGKNLLL